jgi:hypothetical protein
MVELREPQPGRFAREHLADVARQLGALRLASHVEKASLDDRTVRSIETAIAGRNTPFPSPHEADMLWHLRDGDPEFLLDALLGLVESAWLDL